MSLRDKIILVTGASGFIGGRLVEKLILQHGARVRALVRNYRTAINLGRFDLDLVCADITDRDAVCKAAEGCDVVFHCAYGSSGTNEEQRAATVEGTQNICDAARSAGVSRLVYLSTLSVYGDLTGATLHETAARQRTGDLYTDTKIDAEEIVVKANLEHGLPTVILQPTVVYGPFGGWWTAGQIGLMKSGQLALPKGVEGICNAVYVDDVVDACIKSAGHPDAVGETFLVSGPEPVTWTEYYGKLDSMLDCGSIVHLSASEMEQHQSASKEPRTLIGWSFQALLGRPDIIQRIIDSWFGLPYKTVVRLAPKGMIDGATKKTLLADQTGSTKRQTALDSENPVVSEDERPVIVPNAAGMRQLTSTTRVSIQKLRTVLSFEPQFGLDRGMRLTGLWAKWAGLLDS